MRKSLGPSLLVLISTFITPFAHLEAKATFFPGMDYSSWLFVWGCMTTTTGIHFIGSSDALQNNTNTIVSTPILSLIILVIGVSQFLAILMMSKRERVIEWIRRYGMISVVLQIVLPMIPFFYQIEVAPPGSHQFSVFPIPITGLIAYASISDIKQKLLKSSEADNAGS